MGVGWGTAVSIAVGNGAAGVGGGVRIGVSSELSKLDWGNMGVGVGSGLGETQAVKMNNVKNIIKLNKNENLYLGKANFERLESIMPPLSPERG